MPRLPRSFFARPCLQVAPDLLGLYLVRGDFAGRIVEVEAYVHEEDQACHARVGRTRRTEMLYGPPGYAYVFLIYGMYDCFNVVTEAEGSPAAVLVRAVEPVPPLEGGTDGPGKLCRALGINRAHNGQDLVDGALVWIERRNRKKVKIATTPRIGVDYAGEWALRPWRFIDADSPWVSKARGVKAPTGSASRPSRRSPRTR
ncbi:MAG: DNA-3-methyladenine glycosylase [Myxococcales bacterium]|nr:DNA-3-methyladenine glycosylase [Myxococcales bacterium]